MEFLRGLFEDWTMVTVYVAMAAVGGTILVLQIVLQLLGGDGDSDLSDLDVDDLDADDGGLGLLSLRAMSAFVTFFGLSGWGGTNAGWSTWVIILVALGCGFGAMVLTGWLISFQRRLQSSGNVRIESAVGRTARVYLRIPGNREGRGKITLMLQGRTVELGAQTPGEAISTGSEVRIVRMISLDTFEVEPA